MALANMTQEETNLENRNTCKQIAEELEEWINGDVYRCPECGEYCNMEEEENENGETVYKCSCGCTSEYEPEQLGLFDYFNDMLDITYITNSRKEYVACRIMVACGGPNIYINTWDRKVELHWWTDHAEYYLSHTACDAIDECMEEYFNCL